MAFDVQGARAAGYSDAEIAGYLAKEQKFDVAGARKAGYSDTEIIGHLTITKPIGTQIPVSDAERQFMASQPATQAPPANPSLVDKLIGGGETALSLATGATGGALGALGGTLGGLAGAIATGQLGTQEGVRNVEQAAAEGANALTYQPRTAEGRQQTAAVGSALEAALPVTPLTAELGAAGQGASNAALGARAAVGATVVPAAEQAVARIRQAAPAIAERVQRTLSRNPEPQPTPGTLGSVGSAGTDIASQRQQLADQVGVKLTSGQLTRDQQQLRFEQETAKGEQGSAFRDRYSDQNEQVQKHFENLIDRTGKESADLAGTGQSVDQALKAKYENDRARVRVAYKDAEKSAESAEPVTLDSAIQFLNESAPDAEVSKLLGAARRHAIKLGAAVEDADGNLVAQPTTVKNAELLRRAIGNATDYEPTNVRNAAILKGEIDAATAPVAGPLYRNARRMRENLAKQYEDRGIIASLLNNKRGTADRKVAIADVFDHSILNASRENVAYVRRALTAHAKDAAADVRELGQQAWRDLQGETLNWIKDQAFANTATDQRGNVILSVPKLNNAIKRLDADRRLETIFGKQGAQHLRDVNDLAKVIYTVPPGAVNTSNTASVLLAALGEAGVTGSLTGLPVPVLSTLRLVAKQVKNHRIQKRIEQALAGRVPQTAQTIEYRPSGATLH